MTQPKLYDPEHWHRRAEELLTIAGETRDASSKATLLQIANEYEILARRADARRKESSHPAAEKQEAPVAS